MRTDARKLYDEGFGCNAIAAKLGISPSVISRWAKDNELGFDRTQTEMAVRAHTIDMAADRILLAQKMIVNASDSLDMLDHTFLVYNFGGKDNIYQEHYLEAAPLEARRNAQAIAGIAFDKATRIVEKDNGGLDQAIGTLDLVADTLKAAAEAYRADGETPVEPE